MVAYRKGANRRESVMDFSVDRDKEFVYLDGTFKREFLSIFATGLQTLSDTLLHSGYYVAQPQPPFDEGAVAVDEPRRSVRRTPPVPAPMEVLTDGTLVTIPKFNSDVHYRIVAMIQMVSEHTFGALGYLVVRDCDYASPLTATMTDMLLRAIFVESCCVFPVVPTPMPVPPLMPVPHMPTPDDF